MPITSATDDLLVEIHKIEELNDFRDRFAKMRTFGRQALKQYVECFVDSKRKEATRWQLSSALRHHAQVIKALSRTRDGADAVKPLLEKIRTATLHEILGDPSDSPLFHDHDTDGSHLTYLDAAYALDALASAPEAVLAPVTMYFYYGVIRELYYPTPPLWIVGGARAGEGGRPTAFVTSQFVRAILSFSRMLHRSSVYFGALCDMQMPKTGHADWDNQEAKRRALSLYTSLAQRSWNLAVNIGRPAPATLAATDIVAFEAAVRHDLIKGLAQAVNDFEAARKAVEDYRTVEKAAAAGRGKTHLIDRSEGAHAVAFRALSNAVDRAREATKVFAGENADGTTPLNDSERQRFAKQLAEIEQQFQETADSVKKLIRPALDYLSNVLDTQLALASADSGTGNFEPIEMASAAATLGAAGDEWADERLMRAARFLGGAMGRDGFSISQPFHTAGGSSYYQAAQQHVIAAYAQILEHVQTELAPAVLTRITRYFDQTSQPIDAERRAWRWVHVNPNSSFSPLQTAIATIALDRLCRMLDRRINLLILHHFNEKKPGLKLDDLFYPDYGLAIALEQKGKDERMPIAVALERMRAHIAGVSLAPPYSKRFYSAIFHGPPGTGKTTLMEALALSASVPLIEVTPSDIVVRGSDQIEARASAVLRALSFLTEAVVIFDEFDPVLKTREGDQGPQSIFTFLTASMLPKLKTLYEAAKERRVAFALATNELEKLDPAAIRGGRFDAHIGVYPPDALSRFGRLLNEIRLHMKEGGKKPTPARFEIAVRKTAGASMQDIGKPGWFTRPVKGKVQPDTLFDCLYSDAALPKLDKFEMLANKGSWSPDERDQWGTIQSLEDQNDDLGKSIWKSVKAAFDGS